MPIACFSLIGFEENSRTSCEGERGSVAAFGLVHRIWPLPKRGFREKGVGGCRGYGPGIQGVAFPERRPALCIFPLEKELNDAT